MAERPKSPEIGDYYEDEAGHTWTWTGVRWVELFRQVPTYVYTLVRVDNEQRASRRPVVIRNVVSVHATLDGATQAIPHWADNRRRAPLEGNEMVAMGAENIEFVVEQWEVRTG